MECYLFRQSKAPTGAFVDLYNIRPEALFGQATIDSSMVVRGTWSEGLSSGAFVGKYSSQPAQFDVTGSVAFGYQDNVKIFYYAGSTRAQVKTLPPSPVPTRNVQAGKFTYRDFVAYCVGAEPAVISQPSVLPSTVFPTSCVFYAKPDVNGYFFGSVDGNQTGSLSGQVCLAGSGCVGYGGARRVDLSAQVLRIPLPDGSGSISYNFMESLPGNRGSLAKEVRFYHSSNSALLPEKVSCTLWSSEAAPSDSGGNGNNIQFPPPPAFQGGSRLSPPGM